MFCFGRNRDIPHGEGFFRRFIHSRFGSYHIMDGATWAVTQPRGGIRSFSKNNKETENSVESVSSARQRGTQSTDNLGRMLQPDSIGSLWRGEQDVEHGCETR